MTDDQKYGAMRVALRADRDQALKNGHKHVAAAFSELLLSGMPTLVAMYDNWNATVPLTRPVGEA